MTAALAPDGPKSLADTVSGLEPGANLLAVFRNRADPSPMARLHVARAQLPTSECSSASFAVASLPGANLAIASVTPVAAASTVPEHCLVGGTIDPLAAGVSGPSAPTSRPGSTSPSGAST